MNCAFCPHHKCYTSGQNCTRLTHEEISEYYTDEDKKMMRASSATESPQLFENDTFGRKRIFR